MNHDIEVELDRRTTAAVPFMSPPRARPRSPAAADKGGKQPAAAVGAVTGAAAATAAAAAAAAASMSLGGVGVGAAELKTPGAQSRKRKRELFTSPGTPVSSQPQTQPVHGPAAGAGLAQQQQQDQQQQSEPPSQQPPAGYASSQVWNLASRQQTLLRYLRELKSLGLLGADDAATGADKDKDKDKSADLRRATAEQKARDLEALSAFFRSLDSLWSALDVYLGATSHERDRETKEIKVCPRCSRRALTDRHLWLCVHGVGSRCCVVVGQGCWRQGRLQGQIGRQRRKESERGEARRARQ